MASQNMGGVINPFALTEALIGKRIDWSKQVQPLKLVESTLGIGADELFDSGKGSVIFALQKLVMSSDGLHAKLKELGGKGELLDLSANVNPELKDKLTEILLPVGDSAGQETEYPGATWRDLGDFFEEGTEFGDPVQGGVGDCWLIAALSSVAWSRPYAIMQRNRDIGPDNNNFVDALEFADAPGSTKMFEVTENVPVSNSTNRPLFASSSEPGEIWPCVYEKAYAKLRSGNLTDKPDIRILHGGDPVDACVKLVPGLAGTYMWTANYSANDLWSAVTSNSIANPGISPVIFGVKSGRTVNPLTSWTYEKASYAPDPITYDATTGIVGWHCYSVLGWISVTTLQPHPPNSQIPALSTKRYIVLRNPWGVHEGKVDVLTGDWRTYDRSWWRNTPLNTGGLFAIGIETFKKYFAGLGVSK